MLISYNWLKSYIPEIPNEDEIVSLITFHVCEIEDINKLPNGDTIFDLKILPNRAHDLLSHQGVAREISGLLGLEFKIPEYKIPTQNNLSETTPKIFSEKYFDSKLGNLKIDIETPKCRRYIGRIVRNLKVGPSPEWMVKFLEGIGQRSINNIVDATNMVMFDCGQPIHAFDLEQLQDKKIVIKEAQNDEKIELVGSEKNTVILKDTDVVITDGKKSLAIAGVKGALGSGVKEETKDILIEVANFEPISVRKTARRLFMQTEASKRYENDLSPELCEQAMNEISHLVYEMCPEVLFEEVVDIYPEPQEERKVSFKGAYVSKMLGVNINNKEIEKILKNYNYNFTQTEDNFEVTIPSMRLDLIGSRDFVEEIGRVYGYEKIIPEIPKVDFKREDNSVWIKTFLVKQKLINDGYREVMTYVFRNKGDLEVLASPSGKNFLRTNLTDGIKESISFNQKNLPLLGLDDVKVFEVGTVFTKKGEQLNVAYGDKKNVIEISLNKFIKDAFPEFSSENILTEILKPSNSENMEIQVFKPWSIYPFMTRDIAVWTPEGIGPEMLIDIYKDFGTELLVIEPQLFDSFTKNKKTSFAYRLVFQSMEKTLTDEEINPIMDKINAKISELGWEVR